MTKRKIQAAENRAEVGPQRAKPASVAQIKAQSKQAAIGVLQAELADLRKRHGDNLKFIKTLVSEKAVAWKRIKELEGQVQSLRISLIGAAVDYDRIPYQMATEEYDRLERFQHWYILDKQAVDDIASGDREHWYETANEWMRYGRSLEVKVRELEEQLAQAQNFLNQEISDWAATDTYCRAKAAEVLPAFEVYGDKDGVPPIEAVVDKLVECVSPKRKEDRAGVAVTPEQD